LGSDAILMTFDQPSMAFAESVQEHSIQSRSVPRTVNVVRRSQVISMRFDSHARTESLDTIIEFESEPTLDA
jgi:hypothetical protein